MLNWRARTNGNPLELLINGVFECAQDCVGLVLFMILREELTDDEREVNYMWFLKGKTRDLRRVK